MMMTMNGGEAGYVNMRDIEQHKNDIRRELKKANGKIPVKRAWDLLGERFDEYNRAVENCARFAAFVTSREMGRSIDRSVYDAKEISVNFNKKGSGAKFLESVGQTKAGNVAALVSGLGRSGYVFWNAAIQGTTNFGRQIKRHPAKAFTGAAAMFLLGAVTAYLGGDDDDDKNAYYNLPEYVRRSNILFSAGKHWISLPLPIEYRAFYGMGELMVSTLSGKEHFTGGEIASAIAGQATQVLPIDFLEGGGGLNAFIPSAAKPLWEAYVVEKSWTGMPLYKNTPYNKDMPEWTKAYKSANKYMVGLAEVMNEVTGGDAYTKGAVDINPAKVEYLLNGYFGGVSGTIDKMVKTAETIAGTREYDPRSVLLMNRLVKAGDERTEYRAVKMSIPGWRKSMTGRRNVFGAMRRIRSVEFSIMRRRLISCMTRRSMPDMKSLRATGKRLTGCMTS
ncbi:LPD38 domain-containing protein [Bacteroides sp.]|uniref:LPD38 domain-containing protein n=1 Tax=Bacteroides sp. TaxID=29523 RepID=UPI002618D02A|nr:LPD38 domain-containing protein [Bacteroides sp.]